ncbi:MAG: DUF1643 domain-containing protein [Sulfobacillus sp.]
MFSDDLVYRYTLTRKLSDQRGSGTCVFCMLNPSTADAMKNDPTVRRCVGYAQQWGFGTLTVVNIFALRSTDPKALYDHADPVGQDNDWHISRAAETADLFVCAWGGHGGDRGKFVIDRLRDKARLMCLTINKDGSPGHPLYLPGDLMPVPLISEAR